MDFSKQNKNVRKPRYHDQISIRDLRKKKMLFTKFFLPTREDPGSWIHQKAWMQLGDLTQKTENNYSLGAEGNGVYIFVIEGSAKVGEQQLEKRDALGVWDTADVTITAAENSRLLLIDVPLKFLSHE